MIFRKLCAGLVFIHLCHPINDLSMWFQGTMRTLPLCVHTATVSTAHHGVTVQSLVLSVSVVIV